MTKTALHSATLRTLAVIGGILLPILALAAEGAEQVAEVGGILGMFTGETHLYCEHNFCWTIHGFYVFDFIVFVGLLVFAARKPIAAMLDKRYQDVAKEIAAARQLQIEAQAKLDDYRARIAGLELELQRLLAEVRHGTESEVQRILAEAATQVQRITAEEAVRLEQESKRLREELQHEAALLALRMAEDTLKQRLDGAGQAKLVDRALADIDRLNG